MDSGMTLDGLLTMLGAGIGGSIVFGLGIEYYRSVLNGEASLNHFIKRKIVEKRITSEKPPFKREEGQLYLDLGTKEYYQELSYRE
jgi:hypothetical protein